NKEMPTNQQSTAPPLPNLHKTSTARKRRAIKLHALPNRQPGHRKQTCTHIIQKKQPRPCSR
ncbi:hypothetical protein, partial [Paraburkholderia bannensis]|uniref:hypothetical protein n=1 Tax=Paraburkholderia bannensis TaxID=765414 RepID=UPI002ABE733F